MWLARFKFLPLLVAAACCACRSIAGADGASQLQRGTETSGGGLPMDPIIPNTPFRFVCNAAFVHDTSAGSAAAAATFELTNSKLSVQSSELPWQFGYVNSLVPLAPLAPGGGDPDLFHKDVQPSVFMIAFSHRLGEQTPDIPFDVQLSVMYSVTKGTSHMNHTISTHQAFTPGVELNVDGKAYANGAGEDQSPFLVAARCIRQP